MIEEREFIIYHKILHMIDNCQIIEEDSSGIIIEIDLLEHRKLRKNLTYSFFLQRKLILEKLKKKLNTLILWEILSSQ